ncbi:MAG: hypothetical protein IT380_10065 [Myxococcales bacterium]|nr:hypothetical protein [Myxococcales bacterium]
MNENDRKKLYAALAAPFPEEAIERTDGRQTGKGYSTTGIKYQYVVNRLNEVLGFGAFRAHRTITVKEIKRTNGRPAFEAICDLTLELGQWVDGKFLVFAEALADGGHVASSEADARKGCFTNAFKKAAAFFGCGKQAYEGTLDDDNLPTDEEPQRAPAPQVEATPPGYNRSPPAGFTPPAQQQQNRNRLSSKQLSAIWSIARKLGHEQGTFRSKVKAEFGKALEFLSKEEASMLISRLNGHLNGNGDGHHEAESQVA